MKKLKKTLGIIAAVLAACITSTLFAGCDGLLVQIVKRGVGPVVKEVLLHILHAVLYLAFRLGISRAAEDCIERTALNI